MKKRLRKKFHLGEFRVFGFDVSFRFDPVPDDEAWERFWVRWIDEAIEGNGLHTGGGGTNEFWHPFVCGNRPGDATERQRQAVEAWVRAQAGITDIRVGPLVDAWHGPFDD